MKLKVVVHEAEEGGFWAEVPAIPGCATQGETFEETSKSQRRVERSGSWKSRYESAVRARTRATRGRERMAPAKGQRQPPYLRQARQRGSAFVPIHGNRPLKRGLLRHLLKLAGIGEVTTAG